MKTTSILCVATVLIGLPGIAWSHWPPEPYRAVEIPDERLPVIDGDLSDWDWVPEEYVITSYDLYIYGSVIDSRWDYIRNKGKNIFEARLIVGWNAHTNRLYFAAEVYDMCHIIHYTAEHPDWIYLDDCFMVMLDADNSGGEYAYWGEAGETLDKDRHHAQATTYVMSVSGPSTPHIMSFNPGDWVTQPPWVEVGGDTRGEINSCKLEEKLEKAETTTFYELSIVPFDFLSWLGPERSTIHTLKGDEIIGLSVAFDNFGRYIESDPHMLAFSSFAEFSTGQPLMHGNADYFSDFLLVHAEEEDVSQVSGSSWGRIKSTFLSR